MIETFKIVKGFEGININEFFTLSSSVTRGHSLKLYKDRFCLDIAKFSFSNRVIDEWNLLPNDVIDSPNVNAFKNRLDRYLVHVRGLK